MNRIYWHPEHDKFLKELVAKRKSYSSIAREMSVQFGRNFTEPTIRSRLYRMGITAAVVNAPVAGPVQWSDSSDEMPLRWQPLHDEALRSAVRECSSIREVLSTLTAKFGRPVTDAMVRGRMSSLHISARDIGWGRAAQKAAPDPSGQETTIRQEPSTDPAPAPEVDIPIEIDEPEAATEGSEQDSGHKDAVARLVDSDNPVSDDSGLIDRLLSATRKKAATLETICDMLELPPGRVRTLIEKAKTLGYRVDLEAGHVGVIPQRESDETFDLEVDKVGELHTIALVGDIHKGNKHHQRAPFEDFCRLAYEAGARKFLHVGDLLDGVYKHSRWEQSAHGFEQQSEMAIEEIPRLPGADWYMIQGNHDETLGEDSGLEVGRALEQKFRAAGRDDFHYLGARGAYIRLCTPGQRGIYVHLWHPSGRGAAYAKSYNLQKKVEGYAPGSKPDILGCGHYHQCLYTPIRGVHAFGTGCWQGGQSSFGKSLKSAPDIGSWIVQYSLTSGGTIRELRPSWIGYLEKETVRDVEMG
jgi:UDP-2,3-diacylglucosamine pyrophosphatase LpxH